MFTCAQVVQDTLQDARFSHNPYVSSPDGPGIRFYVCMRQGRPGRGALRTPARVKSPSSWSSPSSFAPSIFLNLNWTA